MRSLVRSTVDIARPADVVWDYVTDWPRQAEWIPMTRVEVAGRADRVGGRIRAWTGLGSVGFWDTMTITAWRPPVPDAATASCEALHTGAVVRGDGGFVVEALSAGATRFVWWERLDIPGGPLGGLAWRAGGRGMGAMVDLSLSRLKSRLETR